MYSIGMEYAPWGSHNHQSFRGSQNNWISYLSEYLFFTEVPLDEITKYLTIILG